MSCFHAIPAYKITWEDGTTEIKFRAPKENHRYKWEQLNLPCGKCIGCKLDKAGDWALRCYLEASNWKQNCFITLTYNDKKIPKNGLLRKRHIQLFLKKLRYYHQGIEQWENPQNGKTEKPIRYICVGEYGPSEKGTHRPHYHMIIFNWKPARLEFYKYNKYGDPIYKCKELTKIWGKGFVTVEDMNYYTASYVSRYTTKKLFAEVPKEVKIKQKLEPEFILMSRNGGIGLKYWKEYKEKIIEFGIYMKLKDKVKQKNMPKYFERKFKEENESEFKIYQEKKIARAKAEMEKALAKTSLSEWEYKANQERKLIEKSREFRRDGII